VTPNDEAPSRGFPDTSWSAVLGVRSADEAVRARSLEAVAQVYWKPVYKHVRLRWGRVPEDAQDLTQEFFSRALEKGFFDAWDPARGKFRTFLRVCLDGFLANEAKAAGRLKRGGTCRSNSSAPKGRSPWRRSPPPTPSSATSTSSGRAASSS
jgi:DNA-directed RNA polymerase specialized sigma24 family protein